MDWVNYGNRLVLALKYTGLDVQLYDDVAPKSELNDQGTTTQWK
jgi:hypothetical protein